MNENNLQCEFSPLLTYTMKVNNNSSLLNSKENKEIINDSKKRNYGFKYSIC